MVILCLEPKTPAKRAISHLQHNSQVGLGGMESYQMLLDGIDELETEIAFEPEKAEQLVLDITCQKRQHNNFLALGCYELLLRRWKRAFGPEQLLTLHLDDLSGQPQQTMNQVFDYLGLKQIKIRQVSSNRGTYDVCDPKSQSTLRRLEKFYSRVAELTDPMDRRRH